MKSRIAEKNSDQLKQLFAKNPNSLLFSRVADQYRKEGNMEHAIELCLKGLEAHPEYVTGRIILGRCYIEMENYNSAIDEFITVCKLDRRNHVAIKMLADIFVKRGETEKAGDLYRILTQLDPFDTSFKILASRFDTTGKNDLLDILGVQTSAANVLPEFPPSSESLDRADDYFDNSEIAGDSTGTENFNDNSIDQMLSSFSEDIPRDEIDNSIGVTGSDIDNRMNSLFGEEEPTSSNPVSDDFDMNIHVSDKENQILSGMSSMQPVSGKDISSRIDELFDIPERNVAEQPDIRKDGTIENMYPDNSMPADSGHVVSEQEAVDELGGSGRINVSDHTVDEDISDIVKSSSSDEDIFSDNIIPFSKNQSFSDPVNDEFEETLQFDRSMFSRLNDEPDYEELVSSSPFLATGKTEELYQEYADEPEDGQNNDSIHVQSHSDDASVQYELQSLNYEPQSEEQIESSEKSVIDSLQSHSPGSSVTEDTVFHGNYQFGELNDVMMDDNDDESADLLSADNFADKIESIFGEEHTEMENVAETSEDANESSEQSALLSVSGIAENESIGDSAGKLTLEMPDFQMPELPDISDSMVNDVSHMVIDTDINELASELDAEDSASSPEIIQPEDDLMALQSATSDDAADTEIPSGDLFVKSLSGLNLVEDSDSVNHSDSEMISSNDSLMFLQNEDQNAEPVNGLEITDGGEKTALPDGNDLDDFMSGFYEEKRSDVSDGMTEDEDEAGLSSQSALSVDSGLDGIQSSDVKDIPDDIDIFMNLPNTQDLTENSESDQLVHPILEIDSEDIGVRSIDPADEAYNDAMENEEKCSIVLDQDNADVNISDTGISLLDSVTDFGVVENLKQDNDPVLLVDNDSDLISVEIDENVVSDMDVLVVSSENEQMTGDDVAEKIQDIFELAEFREKKQSVTMEEPVRLIEDDQEYTLDNISGTDNKAMVDLSDETFVEDRSEYIGDTQKSNVISGNELPVIDRSDLVVDSEPEETLVIPSQNSLLSETNEERNWSDQQVNSLLELSDSVSVQKDELEASEYRHPGTNDLIIEDADGSEVLSGSDVEERLEEFFGADLFSESSVNTLIPEDEEIEETLIQDFYTLSGENTANAVTCENMEGVDKVELDRTVDFVEDYSDSQMPENKTIIDSTEEKKQPESVNFVNDKFFDTRENEPLKMSDTSDADYSADSDSLPEMVDEESAVISTVEMAAMEESPEPVKLLDSELLQEEKTVRFSAADLFDDDITEQMDLPVIAQATEPSNANQPVQEIDERDAPYTIPDHVLTPTLADIYFQQGQYQLALQIYSRLFESDPDNDRIQSRIVEIKTCIEQCQIENKENRSSNHVEKSEKKPLSRTSMKENPLKSDSRPLAGVKIPKKKKINREQRKKS